MRYFFAPLILCSLIFTHSVCKTKICDEVVDGPEKTIHSFIMCLQYRSFLKTQWEKEKLLVISNFSFSHNVFYPFGELAAIFMKIEMLSAHSSEFGRIQNLSFGKGLIEEVKQHMCTYTTSKCFQALILRG